MSFKALPSLKCALEEQCFCKFSEPHARRVRATGRWRTSHVPPLAATENDRRSPPPSARVSVSGEGGEHLKLYFGCSVQRSRDAG